MCKSCRTHQKLTKCPKPTGFFIHPATGRKVPANCGRWDCPYCGPKKKRKFLWKVQTALGMMSQVYGYKWRHLMLSVAPGNNKFIMKYWNRFRSMLRKAKIDLKAFVWTKEYQQNGSLHLHILIANYVHWKKALKYWRRASGGQGQHIRINKSDILYGGRYLAKYMTEEMETSKFLPRERRYGNSRNLKGFFPLEHKQKKQPGWLYEHDPEWAPYWTPDWDRHVLEIYQQTDAFWLNMYKFKKYKIVHLDKYHTESDTERISLNTNSA